LGYCYGPTELITPINSAANVIYVCPATPLQAALAKILLKEHDYYEKLTNIFSGKKMFLSQKLRQLGFEIYDSGSSFYLWARIPQGFSDAVSFNQMLIEKRQVAGVPGNAFSDSERWNSFMRFCIARDDKILESAVERIQAALSDD
jgi:aminotransferase